MNTPFENRTPRFAVSSLALASGLTLPEQLERLLEQLEPQPKTSLSLRSLSTAAQWREWTQVVLPAVLEQVEDAFSPLRPQVANRGFIAYPPTALPVPPVAFVSPVPFLPLERPAALLKPSGWSLRPVVRSTPSRRESIRSRATRAAAQLARRYDWEEGFAQLEEYLDRERWGQLRSTLEREIKAGLTPDEFELVLALRAYTADDDRFVLYRYGFKHYRTPLTWELTLRLVRQGCADATELEGLLERVLDFTLADAALLELPAFSDRLEVLLDLSGNQDLDLWLSRKGF